MKTLLRILTLCCLVSGLSAVYFSPALAQSSHGTRAKAHKPKTYRNVRGLVVAVVRPKRAGDKTAVTLDHEAIPQFMRAMRMTLPLKNSADAGKLRPGAKIQFDLLLQNGNFVVANIKALPAKTKLKLAPA